MSVADAPALLPLAAVQPRRTQPHRTEAELLAMLRQHLSDLDDITGRLRALVSTP